MEVSLNEAETRYYRDLFICCDVEKTGKVPITKAQDLFATFSEKKSDEKKKIISEITSLAGIADTALHVSKAQFFGCLKLIAAYQADIPLRKELIVASNVQLPLPRFSWKQSPSDVAPQTNGSLVGGQPSNAERRNSQTHGSRRNSNVQLQQQEAALNSDVQSTDSEVEQNESSCEVVESGGHGSSGREMHHRRRAGSPEAWSTNSDSPTPTNSVAERPWAKENLWHGLLGDEHRQLLGTEEESSDRHSSDDEETDLETVYQITPEQREYYFKQFKYVQHDPNGLLSGQVAKDFFEKSRIPVEELRHIWQLCDVTRDGALSLSEFTAAMHLVVLRRNNIPLPTTLPACLHPNVLQHSTLATAGVPPTLAPPAAPQEPPEADLLHLNDDDEEENTENTIINTVVANTSATTTTNAIAATVAPTTTTNQTTNNEKNVMNLSTLSQDVPPTQWTKFTESPTSNVSSPGPKPVNFDMQRDRVVSDPQILHPVPLRLTPVGGAIANTTAAVAVPVAATAAIVAEPQDIGDGLQHNLRSYSPKQQLLQNSSINSNSAMSTSHHRDLLQQQCNSDLRAIQRPQPKKLPNKGGAGAIPPPPQREPSVCSASSGGINAGTDTDSTHSQQQMTVLSSSTNKKDIQPPLPPPRPHRHGRSNSLDLNKFKIGSSSGQQAEITAQASFDLQTSTGFADFTQFSEDGAKCVNNENAEQQHSLPPQQHSQHFENQQQKQQQHQPTAAALPPLSRISLQSNQRVSAFEVYRKPQTPRNSQSPPQPAVATTVAASAAVHNPLASHAPPFGAAGAAAIAGVAPATAAQLPNAEIYEKRVNAITETLRHVSFKPESNMTDILRHLREQNGLLLHLCNDLSDELLTVQTRKEELRQKLDAIDQSNASSNNNGAAGINLAAPPRTGSSISAPVTANITGGSGKSGIQSNV